MNKITVKEFVEGYINCTDSLKKRKVKGYILYSYKC